MDTDQKNSLKEHWNDSHTYTYINTHTQVQKHAQRKHAPSNLSN